MHLGYRVSSDRKSIAYDRTKAGRIQEKDLLGLLVSTYP